MSHHRLAREHVRTGVVLAVVVFGVVGVAGILRWSQRLILTGLVAGMAIIAVTLMIVLTQHWHHRNTELRSSYAAAEDVVQLRRARPTAGSRRKR